MGLLKNIEKKLEKAVEGFFAKGFKSKVEPVELGKKMTLEMINNKVLAMEKVWAPNNFEVKLNPEDNEQYNMYKKELVHELQDYLIKQATEESLSMMGRPKITFKEDKKFTRGQFEIRTKISEDLEEEINKTDSGATQLIPIEPVRPKKTKHYIQIEPSMIQYDLKEGRTSVGRSTTNDISIADPEVSRHHLEIYLEKNEIIVKDIGSTNKTMVNSKIIKSLVLKNKDVIKIGGVSLIYRRSDA